MQRQFVQLERRGATALVVMDNPATANAMDEDLGPQLVAALEALAGDPACRAVVLTGAGGMFSGGGNVVRAHRYLADHPDRGASPVFEGYTKWVSRVLWALTGMPQPVVAAVEGAASGAGLAWLLACDLVLLAADARVLPGFLAIGLTPAAGVTLHLPRVLGLMRATEMLMLNQPLAPTDCLRLGLADRVLPAAEVLPAALELADRLAQGPQKAIAATKRLLGRAARRGLLGQIEDERRAVMAAADQPDFAALAGRFVAKSKSRSG
ncbi:MAG: enoyl-CoA hydratase/isomerase family protein [Thermodesulfobacteriota bacterium]